MPAPRVPPLEQLVPKDAPDADTGPRFTPYLLEQARRDAMAAGEGLSTGFAKLDAEDFRFRPGKLYVAAGRQGEGKTTLLVEILLRHAEQRRRDATTPVRHGPAVFVTYEENLQHVYLRLLLRMIGRSGVDNVPGRTVAEEWLRVGSISGHRDGRWANALGEAAEVVDSYMRDGLLFLLDGDAGTGEVDRLSGWLGAAAKHAEAAPSLVVVDYYQKIRPPLRYQGDSRQAQLQAVADLLRRYAKGEDTGTPVPVLVGAQVTRDAAGGSNGEASKQPELHHIREADDLANDAAGVLTLYRPFENVLSVKVAKNRDGKRGGTAELSFHGPSGYIADGPPSSAARGRYSID